MTLHVFFIPQGFFIGGVYPPVFIKFLSPGFGRIRVAFGALRLRSFLTGRDRGEKRETHTGGVAVAPKKTLAIPVDTPRLTI